MGRLMHEYNATHASVAIDHEALAIGDTNDRRSPMFPNRFDPLVVIAASAMFLIAAVARSVAKGMVRP